MHTNRVKAKVDFKFCMGNIPAMLRATKPVLSEKQYKELCNEVNQAEGYLEQKRIIFSYVDPIIKGLDTTNENQRAGSIAHIKFEREMRRPR